MRGGEGEVLLVLLGIRGREREEYMGLESIIRGREELKGVLGLRGRKGVGGGMSGVEMGMGEEES